MPASPFHWRDPAILNRRFICTQVKSAYCANVITVQIQHLTRFVTMYECATLTTKERANHDLQNIASPFLAPFHHDGQRASMLHRFFTQRLPNQEETQHKTFDV